MPWEIIANRGSLAQSTNDVYINDRLLIKMSVGGGPSYVRWYSKSLVPALNTNLFANIAYKIVITSVASRPDFEIVCFLKSVEFKENNYVYTFVPMAKLLASFNKLYKSPSAKRLKDLEKTIKENLLVKRFEVADKFKDLEIFDGFYYYGRFDRFLSSLCTRLGTEYFISDDILFIGTPVFRNVEPYELSTNTNTIAGGNLFGMDFLLVTSYMQPVHLGRVVRYKNLEGRLFSFVYEYGPDKERTTFYLCDRTDVLSDYHISMFHEGETILPESSIVKFGYQFATEDDGRPKVGFLEYFYKPKADMSIVDKGLAITNALPYAGDGVGMQFPERTGNCAVISPMDTIGASIKVGDIYSEKDNVPVKDKGDFRLTLPNATIYVKENGDIYISGKGKVYIGGGESPTHDKTADQLVNGQKGVARLDDEVTSDNTTDSSYWTWSETFKSALNGWVPVPTDGGAALKAVLAAVIGQWPSSQKSKITKASDNVEAN